MSDCRPSHCVGQPHTWTPPDENGVISLKTEFDWLLLTGGTASNGVEVEPVKNMLCGMLHITPP
jgi:hypothetical protein